MSQVETFIIKLKDMFSEPLHKANSQIEHTRHQYMDLKEMLEGAVIAYGIEHFVEKSIEAYNELEQAQAQIRASIASTKGVAGVTFEDAEKSAERFQKQSLYTVDAIERVQSQVLTFKAITKDQFDGATEAIINLSTKMQGDLKGSVIQVSNALQDPIKGIGRLHRVGIDFTETQKQQIKFFQQTNQLAKAQKIILGELTSEFDKSGQASVSAGTGGWTVMKNSFLATQESIGGLIVDISSGLMPILQTLNEDVKTGVVWLKEHETVVKAVAVVLGSLTVAIIGMITATKAWVAIQAILDAELWANPIGIIILAVTGLVAAFYEAYQNVGWFRNGVNALSDTFVDFYNYIKPIFPYVEKGWNILKTIVSGTVEVWVSGFKLVYNTIDKYLLSPIEALIEKLGGLKKILSTLTFGASDAILGAVGDLKNNFDNESALDAIKEEQKALKESRNKGDLKEGGKGKNDGTIDPDGSKIGAGLSEIKTGAPKTFNINIAKMNGIEHFETTNYQEAPKVAGEGLLVELFRVLNNAQAVE